MKNPDPGSRITDYEQLTPNTMPRLIVTKKYKMNGRTLTPGRLIRVTPDMGEKLIATGHFKILEPGDRQKYGEDYEDDAVKMYAEEKEEEE